MPPIRGAAREQLDAIFVLIERSAPRPLELLARVQEYVNARAEEEAETTPRACLTHFTGVVVIS